MRIPGAVDAARRYWGVAVRRASARPVVVEELDVVRNLAPVVTRIAFVARLVFVGAAPRHRIRAQIAHVVAQRQRFIFGTAVRSLGAP